LRGAGQQVRDTLDQYSGSGGFMRGAAAGGVLGLLLGGRGVRKMAGGALGYGGAAALGALALKAWQSYQQRGSVRAADLTPASLAGIPAESLPHERPAADGGPFQLVLVRAMVAAAKADGHIDAAEQQRLFAEVERMGLDSESKAVVFDLLHQPADLTALVASVATPEQGAEVYLASRLAAAPDQPAERAYLDALAARLKLPAEVRAALDQSAV
jgi:uncharacterized membrane protein YebE (DUF533 family)